MHAQFGTVFASQYIANPSLSNNVVTVTLLLYHRMDSQLS